MGDDCINCLQVKSLEDKIKAVWKELEKHYNNIGECENRIKKVEEDTSELKVQFKNIKETLDKIDQKLDKLTEAPGKKWDKATSAIIVAVVSALVGVAMGKIF